MLHATSAARFPGLRMLGVGALVVPPQTTPDSVDDYLRWIADAHPHLTIIHVEPWQVSYHRQTSCVHRTANGRPSFPSWYEEAR